MIRIQQLICSPVTELGKTAYKMFFDKQFSRKFKMSFDIIRKTITKWKVNTPTKPLVIEKQNLKALKYFDYAHLGIQKGYIQG